MRKLLFLFCLLLTPAVFAQDGTETTVPDLTGMTAPQAATAVNDAGLRLNWDRLRAAWTPESGVALNQVMRQSPEAGTPAVYGDAVQITVAVEPNVRMIYDDNDFTLINASTGNLNLGTLVFRSQNASFGAGQWGGALEPGECGQLWSVRRSGAKDVAGCGRTAWISSINTAVHFWTQTAGVSQFGVLINNAIVATCPAAPPNSQDNPTECTFLAPPYPGDAPTSPYVRISYTPDALIFHNNTPDMWMPIFYTPYFVDGVEHNFEDFMTDADVVAHPRWLGANQCLLLVASEDAEAPEDCSLSLRQVVDDPFWQRGFELQASSDGERRTCPPAVADKRVLCILPN